MDYLSFERGLSDRTLSAYRHDLDKLFGFLEEGERRSGRGCSRNDLREFVFHLKDSGLAPSSIRRVLSAFGPISLFFWTRVSWSPTLASAWRAPGCGSRLPSALSVEEVLTLLEAPDEGHTHFWRDRAVLELLYATGMRVSELVDLKIGDVDLDQGVCAVFGKGSKERLVPLGTPARGTMGATSGRCGLASTREKGEGEGFLNHRGRPSPAWPSGIW
jgi:integrase/recombinase XerD